MPEVPAAVVAAFIAGALLQAFYFVQAALGSLRALGYAAFLGAVGLALGFLMIAGGLFDDARAYAYAFCIMTFPLGAAIDGRNLPQVNARVLLISVLGFLYMLLSYYREPGLPAYAVLVGLGTLGAVLYLAWRQGPLTPQVKAAYYVLFLFMLALTGAYQVVYGFLKPFSALGEKGAEPVGAVHAFFSGLAYAYTMAYASYLYMLSGLASKGVGKDVRSAHHKALAGAYDENTGLTAGLAGVMLLLQGSLMVSNYYLRFLPDAMLVTFTILTPLAYEGAARLSGRSARK